MEMMLRNIFIALCLTVYSFFTFSSTVVLVSSEKVVSEGVYQHETSLSDLSRVIFPQTYNSNGGGLSFISLIESFSPKIVSSTNVTKVLENISFFFQVNYIKKTAYLVLKFSPEDMIYPYHTFW